MSRSQLLELGVASTTITEKVARGEWVRLAPGISATHEHTSDEPTLDVKAQPRRFHGHITLEDPVRLGAKAGEIAEFIVAQLAKHAGTDVTVTVEIEATSAEGFAEDTIRAVTENATTLKFDTHGFEVS
ncbi:MAG: hypothetical protein DYH08_08870 [Actinobacteria bacterium ATB1]|nr:hypothetical protein [Actinobacteria bacterium ATB1]